ncbi:archaellin/type IV pilin N-terminal domain-containing protein [Halorubrum sp. Atlit-26R]|uniref:archaellin/type IV pilin N-terminal domain-containing protein n=1 Tax=Halorubrum sp. Atlit-26R TaxID=2282128 RepID=UPI000EF22920|nr:archaellin/type IV pilin N-terminal domain-containing protein [Halorubrum sp. Atlit-26R]RLM63046.1 flagellin [Halorubrum sp. Atlit-26R]
MFEFINNDDDRGQVGIGTLIVFIAMVLVAAIAAGVLINTAGFLQSQAEATGQESTDLVSERIDVTSTVGIVNDNTDPQTLSEIRVGVAGAAGSNQIDLSSATIQAVGPNGQENLIFTDNDNATGNGADNGDTLLDDSSMGVSDIPEGTFAVQNSTGNYTTASEAVLNDNERFTVVFNPETEPFGETDDAFSQGQQSSLDIVSPSGATTSVDLRAPDLFTEGGEAVRL